MSVLAGMGLAGALVMCLGLCTGCTFLTCFGGSVMVLNVVMMLLNRDEE